VNLHQFRQILVVTLLLPLVLLLLLALVLAWQIQRTLREQRRIDHTDRITAQLNEMERLVVDQETGLRGTSSPVIRPLWSLIRTRKARCTWPSTACCCW
jgi:CHASE1-domain containing sensor protein